jgi:pimeloyl-ACP methyl ester carboxylesterase
MAAKRHIAALAALVTAVALAACGGDEKPETAEPAAAQEEPKLIEGKFDVGPYELYMRCEGSGSPTIVYLHGYIPEKDAGGAKSALSLPMLLSDEHRICVYDRPNLNRSDDVPGLRGGKSSVRDLENLLDAAKIEPPYVLLGASYGGMIAYLYANTHPDEVEGMVLLDAAFPDELGLEKYFPAEERFKNEAWEEEAEKLDQYDVYRYAQQFIGKEPDIPVTYLLATPSGWTGPPAYQAVILDKIAAYVDRFSPGTIEKVRSPHYMEAAVPERIAKEVEQLIASSSN